MISALKALFEPAPRETEADRRHHLNLAAAALLVETARSDFTQDESEQAAFAPLLRRALDLSEEEVHAIIQAAEDRVDEATSLYEFTRVINDYGSPEQKRELIEAMWMVAYVDGNLDTYEEHLIRKAAELIYVPHTDYIAAKLAAQKQMAGDA